MGSCYPSDVIREAEKWIGYTEEGDNWTIFAQCLDRIHYFNGNKQNIAWCGTYDYYCILKACLPEDRSDEEKKWDALYFTYQPTKDNCACACRYGADYFRNNGAFYTSDPKKGDIIFFGKRGEETHQGFVRYVDDGRVYTIEGNKNNAVQLCDYSLNYSRISGYGRPRYDEEPEPTPPTPPEPTKDKYTVHTNSGDALRLREEPNTSSKQIGWIDDGTTFMAEKVVEGESIGGCTAWVYYNGGYASGKYLDPTPVVPDPSPVPPEPAPTTTEYKVKTNGGTLSLRNEPALTGSDVIASIPNGTVLDVTEIVEGEMVNNNTEWAHTTYSGKTGYCTCSWLVKCDDSAAYYTVVKGDTLWQIAQKFGITLAKILELNEIANPNVIQIGQKIKVR